MQELNGERPKTKVGVLQESTREEAAKGVSPPPLFYGYSWRKIMKFLEPVLATIGPTFCLLTTEEEQAVTGLV